MNAPAYRPKHFGKPTAPPPAPSERCACGEFACYFAGPPLQLVREGWCPRCVPIAYFTWRCTRNPNGRSASDPPSYAAQPRPTGLRLQEAELAMLQRLNHGEPALADPRSKADLAERLTALSSLQHAGLVTAERTLTGPGKTMLAEAAGG